ncbi:hypothetical protein DFQ29_002948, partial [Apophysomyces sp. BC1021]
VSGPTSPATEVPMVNSPSLVLMDNSHSLISDSTSVLSEPMEDIIMSSDDEVLLVLTLSPVVKK